MKQVRNLKKPYKMSQKTDKFRADLSIKVTWTTNSPDESYHDPFENSVL